MAEKISTILLKVNLECCRSNTKIRMVLCMLQEREKIQTIEFDEKKNTVKVSGPFDPHLLSKKLLCLACDVIMGIEILPPPPPPPPPPPSDPPKPKPPTPPPCPWPPNVLCPYPPWQCSPPPQCPWPPNVKCPYPEWPGCSRQPCPCPCSEHQGGRGGPRCCSCGKTDSGWCPPPSCRHCGGAGGCSWCARPSCGYCGGAGGCSRCAGSGCKIVCEGDPPYD